VQLSCGDILLKVPPQLPVQLGWMNPAKYKGHGGENIMGLPNHA